MPLFFALYLSGLALALLIGVACYWTIGGQAGPVARELFGPRAGPMWATTFRSFLVAMALIGGLSVSWYGCNGYKDRGQVAQSRPEMLAKTSQQVVGALNHTLGFLGGAGAVAALAFAVLRRRGATGERKPGSAGKQLDKK